MNKTNAPMKHLSMGAFLALGLTACVIGGKPNNENPDSGSTPSSPVTVIDTSLRGRLTALTSGQNLLIPIPTAKTGYVIPSVDTISFSTDHKKAAFVATYASTAANLFPFFSFQSVASASGQQAVVRTESASGDVSYEIVSSSALGAYSEAGVWSSAISPDGAYVLFITAANNIDPSDNDSDNDLFLKKLSDGSITVIGSGSICAFAPDSSEFLFTTIEPVDGTDVTSIQDLVRYNIATGVRTLVSSSAGGAYGDAASACGTYSNDKLKVTFPSSATNLVAGDTNGVYDIFVKTLGSGAIVRASTAFGGAQGNSLSLNPSFDSTGNLVVFHSYATNLVGADANGMIDVFVKNLTSGVVTQVSVQQNGTNSSSNNYNGVFSPVNDDEVLFCSTDISLTSPVGTTYGHVYIKTLSNGAVERVSLTSTGADSDNGMSDNCPAGFLPGSGNKIFFAGKPSHGVAGLGSSSETVIIRNRSTSTNTLAAAKPVSEPDAPLLYPSYSKDGSKLLFSSTASNLVADDTNAANDIFVFDIATETVARASVNSSGTQIEAAGPYGQFAAANGSKVVFTANVDNLVGSVSVAADHMYLKNMTSGAVQLITADSAGVPANAFDGTQGFSVSPDFTKVAFSAGADNLTPGDSAIANDVFVKTIASGAIQRVSMDTNSINEGDSDSYVMFHAFSPSGNMVLYVSDATNLAGADGNGSMDAFIHSLDIADTNDRISVSSLGAEANAGVVGSSVSYVSDGSVVFASASTNLVTGDTNGLPDAFRWQSSGAVTRLSETTNQPTYGAGFLANGLGNLILTMATNLITGDTNSTFDWYFRPTQSASYTRLALRSDGSEHSSVSYAIESMPTDEKYFLYTAPSHGESELSQGNGRTYNLFVARLPD